MRTIMHKEPVSLSYEVWSKGMFHQATVTLGTMGVIAVLTDPETGEVNEWVTTDTGRETAVSVATWGDLHIMEGDDNPLIASMRFERELYGDCFGTEM